LVISIWAEIGASIYMQPPSKRRILWHLPWVFIVNLGFFSVISKKRMCMPCYFLH
jgi:cytochrome c-type biogenesis protein CcmH/NrfF